MDHTTAPALSHVRQLSARIPADLKRHFLALLALKDLTYSAWLHHHIRKWMQEEGASSLLGRDAPLATPRRPPS